MRTVPLTDDQFEVLMADRTQREAIGKVIGVAIAEASDVRADKEMKFWEAVRTLAGAGKDEQVAVNWLSRCVTVGSKEPTSFSQSAIDLLNAAKQECVENQRFPEAAAIRDVVESLRKNPNT